ncbi:Biotin--[acetyl-CoA-carboxylase] ligase [Alteripontixanthobacter maritimus]|uniref:biotin--[biotin carboxyl-carrier protein] ligase n=1 Tax=Alteripontixanthobacter maritimus TaxID=2161824 RepID=A0A369QA07_9SPHN|nr:biotin--[acetyl-CoA-carboxylase] ligase [Alteripontixanthobacter maritimus]RDC60036.1 Biotin--[acetyl-CoA-carboxylase] ligase [Alteripontixanthobacter maritimus]
MLDYIAETGSTNADLLTRIAANEAVHEGDWLVADRQSAGRGRQSREWHDGLGNFMGSTIVRRGAGDPPAPSLALVAGLAVYEAVRPVLPPHPGLALKWPNDLMVGEAKLAGILLEGTANAVVVGIGVNLVHAPALTDRRTAALSQFGPAPGRDHFAESLAEQFATELTRWRSHGLELLTRRWQAAAHPLGTRLTVSEPGEGAIRGTFAGLASDGSLMLGLEDGSVRAIHAGDVNLV